MLKTEKRTFIPKNFRPKVKGETLEKQSKRPSAISYDKKNEVEKIVCIHVKDDRSQTNAIKNNVKDLPIAFLNYDDLGTGWNFSYYKGDLIFYTEKGAVKPTGIYNRAYCPNPSHPKFYLFNHLLRVLESWEGPFIGAQAKNFHNCSKIYQITTTIKTAIQKSESTRFSFPKSYFVKGEANLEKLLKRKKQLIVKSCSGIRSEVTTCDHFKKWERKSILNLPTLFQDLCTGRDIRVHFFQGFCMAVEVKHKEDSIDYRYAKIRSPYTKFAVSEEVRAFCSILSEVENANLIGVDFIKKGKKLFCLESNPSPGWAGFHRDCGDEPDIVQTIMRHLSK